MKERKELEYCLQPKSDFILATEKLCSPHTLVIQKTNRAYEREAADWTRNLESIRQKLTALRSPFLAELLGGDVLQIAGFEGLQLAATAEQGATTAPRPLQTMSASAHNAAPAAPVAGTKRKASEIDIVDLTGETGP